MVSRTTNTGLQVDWVRRQFDADIPARPKAPEPAPSVESVRRAPPTDVQLPVTPTFAGWNRDGSTARLTRAARPTTTLSASEIAQGAPALRSELLRRHRDFLGHVSKAAVASPARPELSVSRAGFSLSASADRIRVSAKDGRVLTIDLTDPERPVLKTNGEERGAAMTLLLETFEAHLVSKGLFGIRRKPSAAMKSLFAYLLGPGGALNSQATPNVPPELRFAHPKLVCWDFNGTVERERNSGFRPDIGFVTDNLNQMGALSVITTSVDPRAVEETMVQANLHFNAYFGGDEVRPTTGKKIYRGVAETYGLSERDAPHHMVTIGDSSTDQSADLPDVIFLNSDADTPAEVIQIFLHRLDALGDGSFARGLDALLERSLDREPQRLRVGNIAFDVVLDDDGGAPCPKITRLRTEQDASAVVDTLRSRPPRSDLSEAAAYALAHRHIENQLPETELAGLAARANEVADPEALLGSLALRSARRHEEVRVARLAADGLDDWLGGHPSASSVRLVVELAVRADDPAVTATLAKWAPTYSSTTRALEVVARDQLADDAAALDNVLAKALETTRSTGPGIDEGVTDALHRAIDRDDLGALREVVATIANDGCPPAVRPLLEGIRTYLPSFVEHLSQKIDERYEKRHALDVEALVAGAQGGRRSATWIANDDAIAALARRVRTAI